MDPEGYGALHCYAKCAINALGVNDFIVLNALTTDKSLREYMAKLLNFVKKSLQYKVKYSVSGNGVARMEARDILRTRQAREQIQAAKAVVNKP